MNQDWDFAKQRSHFIAEGLSNFHDLLIVYPYRYIRSNLNKNSKNGLRVMPFFLLPFYNKKFFLNKLNKFCLRTYFKFIINRYKPDYIWITNPDFYNYIPKNVKSKIIYDCMDDHIFFGDNSRGSKFLNLEKNLIKNASKIFISSNNLFLKLNERERCEDKTSLVRNAYNGAICEDHSLKLLDHDIYKIGYIGLVSEWFDFEALFYTLKYFKNIEYHIIGPIDIDLTDLNKKIKIYGSVQHDELYSYAKDFDCLIMPFKLSELIYSVDPVKLYEYVNFNKPIISVYYPEIKRFSAFVEFYSDKEELKIKIEDLIREDFKKKYSNSERLEFLKNNTWDIRVKKIMKNLEELGDIPKFSF